MSDQYWEKLNKDWQRSVCPWEPSSFGIYAHSPGFCDSQEQYDEITVAMIREFKRNWRKNLHECPCCGDRTIILCGAGEQCDVCGWYDDPYASDYPDEFDSDGLNPMSLNDARAWWREKHTPIAEITEIPKGTPPDARQILWKAGILEQVLRDSKLLTEEEIQEELNDLKDE